MSLKFGVECRRRNYIDLENFAKCFHDIRGKVGTLIWMNNSGTTESRDKFFGKCICNRDRIYRGEGDCFRIFGKIVLDSQDIFVSWFSFRKRSDYLNLNFMERLGRCVCDSHWLTIFYSNQFILLALHKFFIYWRVQNTIGGNKIYYVWFSHTNLIFTIGYARFDYYQDWRRF